MVHGMGIETACYAREVGSEASYTLAGYKARALQSIVTRGKVKYELKEGQRAWKEFVYADDEDH